MKPDQINKQDSYRIILDGVLDTKWADWFNGLVILVEENSTTILEGAVSDQAALHGILAKIRDLGLPVLLVERLEK